LFIHPPLSCLLYEYCANFTFCYLFFHHSPILHTSYKDL
jgi:hypothetical protein